MHTYVNMMSEMAEILLGLGHTEVGVRTMAYTYGVQSTWEFWKHHDKRPSFWRDLHKWKQTQRGYIEGFGLITGAFLLGHEIGHFLSTAKSPFYQEIKTYAESARKSLSDFIGDYDHQVTYTFSATSTIAGIKLGANEIDPHEGNERIEEEIVHEVSCDLIGFILLCRAWETGLRIIKDESLEFVWLAILHLFRIFEVHYSIGSLARQFRSYDFPQRYTLHYPKYLKRLWALVFAISIARYEKGSGIRRVFKGFINKLQALDLSQDAVQPAANCVLWINQASKFAIVPEEYWPVWDQELDLDDDKRWYLLPESIKREMFDAVELFRVYRAIPFEDCPFDPLTIGYAHAFQDFLKVFNNHPDTTTMVKLFPEDIPEKNLRDQLKFIERCRARQNEDPYYPYSASGLVKT